MREAIENLLHKVVRKVNPAYHVAKTSWSQQGEDLVIHFIFKWMLKVDKFSYLDIGANHPFYLSNSYLFYKMGMTGVCVEPDPNGATLLSRKRPKDTVLNVGAGSAAGELDFFVMSSNTLSTFSKEVAHGYTQNANMGFPTIERVERIRVMSVDEILEKYFKSSKDYFISIDVEGLDYEILTAINFSKYRPAVVCIETNGDDQNTIAYMHQYNYLCHATNGTNCIFIDQTRLEKI